MARPVRPRSPVPLAGIMAICCGVPDLGTCTTLPYLPTTMMLSSGRYAKSVSPSPRPPAEMPARPVEMSRSTKPLGSVAAAAGVAGRTVSVAAAVATTDHNATLRSSLAMTVPHTHIDREAEFTHSWPLSLPSDTPFHTNVIGMQKCGKVAHEPL